MLLSQFCVTERCKSLKGLPDKIISEVNSISSTYLIEASSVHLSLDEGFSPEIKISNVDLSIPDKEPVLSFNSLTTKFSLVDLISGKFRVSSVTLDSANLSIVRKHDGFFNLEFGAENIAGADYFDASSLLERLDEFLIVLKWKGFRI